MPVDWNLVAISTLGALASAALLYWYKTKTSQRRIADIQGKVVLITGASSGLGEACAKVFHKCGCQVILAGRNVDALNKVKQALQLVQSDTRGLLEPAVLRLDLNDLPKIPEVAQQAVGLFGQVDLVINNAGISYRGSIEDTALSVDQQLMTVNYLGQVALIKGLLPCMMSQKSGHIVGISSVQGKISIPYRSAYAASKHALQAFFDCLRAELAGTGIQVSLLSPGYINTNLSLNAVCADGSKYGKMDQTTKAGMSAEAMGQQVLQSVLEQRPDVVPAPRLHRLLIVLRAVWPRLFFLIMAKRGEKQRKDYKKSQ